MISDPDPWYDLTFLNSNGIFSLIVITKSTVNQDYLQSDDFIYWWKDTKEYLQLFKSMKHRIVITPKKLMHGELYEHCEVFINVNNSI